MEEEIKNTIDDRAELLAEIDRLKLKCAELEEKAKEEVTCLRCGRDSATKPLKIREDIIQKYFRSMLGQVPFTHTVSTLGGRLTATLTMNRGDVLLAHYNAADGISQNVMLVSTLSSVKVVDPDTDIVKVVYEATNEDLVNAVKNNDAMYDNLLKKLDVVQLAFVRNACDAFVILVNQMIDTINSEDFYEGAGLL